MEENLEEDGNQENEIQEREGSKESSKDVVVECLWDRGGSSREQGRT